MKVERWYDICCDYCGRHLSTDFNTGMLTSREEALQYAKKKGFRQMKGETLCPHCLPIRISIAKEKAKRKKCGIV